MQYQPFLLFLAVASATATERPSFSSGDLLSDASARGVDSLVEFKATNAVVTGGDSSVYISACNSSASPVTSQCVNLQDCATVAGTAVKDHDTVSTQRFYVKFFQSENSVLASGSAWRIQVPANCFHNGDAEPLYNGAEDPDNLAAVLFTRVVTVPNANEDYQPKVAADHSYVDPWGTFVDSYGKLSMLSTDNQNHKYVSGDGSVITFREKIQLHNSHQSQFSLENNHQISVSFSDLVTGGSQTYQLKSYEVYDAAGNSFCSSVDNQVEVKKTTSLEAFETVVSQTMEKQTRDIYPQNFNMSKHSNLVLNFKEAVTIASGSIQFCRYAFPKGRCNETAVTLDIATCTLIPDSSRNLVSCPLPSSLSDGETYYVGIPGDIFNYYAGINHCIIDATIASSSDNACEINAQNDGFMFQLNADASAQSDNTDPELIYSSANTSDTGVPVVSSDYNWDMYFTKQMQPDSASACQVSNDNKNQKVSFLSDMGHSGDIQITKGSPNVKSIVMPPSGNWKPGHTYTVSTNNQSFVDMNCRAWEPKESWTFGVMVNVLSFENEPSLTEGVERSFSLKFKTDALNGALKIGDPNAKIEFHSECLANGPKSIEIGDKDQVLVDREYFVISPTSFWKDNCEYKFRIPQGAFHYGQESVEFSFRTVGLDTQAPSLLYSVPEDNSVMISRRELNVKPLEFFFSEEVEACFPDFDDYVDKNITITDASGSEKIGIPLVQKTDSNQDRQTLTLRFAQCTSSGTSACAQFGDNESNERSWNLKIYPNGKGNLQSSSNYWATSNKKYTVSIPSGVLCDSSKTNVHQNALPALSISFTTFEENDFPNFDVWTPGDIPNSGFTLVTSRNPKSSSDGIRSSSTVDWVANSPHDPAADEKWSIKGRKYRCGDPMMKQVDAFWVDSTNGTQRLAVQYDMDVQKAGGSGSFHLIPSDANPKVPNADSFNFTQNQFTIVGDTVLLDVAFGAGASAQDYFIRDADAVKSIASGCGGLATSSKDSANQIRVHNSVQNGVAKPVVLAAELSDGSGASYHPYARWTSANQFSTITGSCIAKKTARMRLYFNVDTNLTDLAVTYDGSPLSVTSSGSKTVEITFPSDTVFASTSKNIVVQNAMNTLDDDSGNKMDDTTIQVRSCEMFKGADEKTVFFLPAQSVASNGFQDDHQYELSVPAGAFFDDRDEPSPVISKTYSNTQHGPYVDWQTGSFKSGKVFATKSTIVLKFNEDVKVASSTDRKYDDSADLGDGSMFEVNVVKNAVSYSQPSVFTAVAKYSLKLSQAVSFGPYLLLPFRNSADSTDQQEFDWDGAGQIDTATNFTLFVDVKSNDPCAVKSVATGECVQRNSMDSSQQNNYVSFQNVNTTNNENGVEGKVGDLEELFFWPSGGDKIDPRLHDSSKHVGSDIDTADNYTYIMLSHGDVQYNTGTMTFGEKDGAKQNVTNPTDGDGSMDDSLDFYGMVKVLLPTNLEYSKTYELIVPANFFKRSFGAGQPDATWPAQQKTYTFTTIDQPSEAQQSTLSSPKLLHVEAVGFESSSASKGKFVLYFDSAVKVNNTNAKMYLTRKAIADGSMFDSDSQVFVGGLSDPTSGYEAVSAISNDGNDADGSLLLYGDQPVCRHFSSEVVTKASWSSVWTSKEYVEKTCAYKVEVDLFAASKYLVPGQSNSIYFNMDSGFFVRTDDDTKGVAASGFNLGGAQSWSLQESDLIQPALLAVGAGYDGTKLKLDEKFVILFSEKIALDDASAVVINETSTSGTSNCGAADWTCVVDGHQLNITASSGSLSQGTSYKVTVGASAVKDRSGNALDKQYSDLEFFTYPLDSSNDVDADLNAPSGSDHFPAASSTNINPDTTFAVKVDNVKSGSFSRDNIVAGKRICLFESGKNPTTCATSPCETACEDSVAQVQKDAIRQMGPDSIAFSFSSQYSMRAGSTYKVWFEKGLLVDDLGIENDAGFWWTSVQIGCQPSLYDVSPKNSDHKPQLLGWTAPSTTLESSTAMDVDLVWTEPVKQKSVVGASLNFTSNLNSFIQGVSPFVTVKLSANGTLVSDAGSFEAQRTYGGDTRKSIAVSGSYQFVRSPTSASEQSGDPIVVESFSNGKYFDGFLMVQSQGLSGFQALNASADEITNIIRSAEFPKMYQSSVSAKLNVFPANEQSMISPSQVIAVKFNDTVSANTGTIQLAGQPYAVPGDIGTNVFIKGSVVYIVPKEDYGQNKEVTFSIPANTFMKKSGDVVSKSHSVSGKFRVVNRDLTSLKLTKLSPASQSDVEDWVNRGSSFKLEFDKDLKSSPMPQITCQRVGSSTTTLTAQKVSGNTAIFPPCPITRNNHRSPRDRLQLTWQSSDFSDSHGNSMEPGETHRHTMNLLEDFASPPKILMSSPWIQEDQNAVDKPTSNSLVHVSLVFDSVVHMNQNAVVGIRANGASSETNCLLPSNGDVEKSSKTVFVQCRVPFETVGLYELRITNFFNDYEVEQVAVTSYFTIESPSFSTVSLVGPDVIDAGSVMYKGHHYVLGGRKNDNELSGDVYKSADGSTWEKVGSFPAPRLGKAFAATDDQMVILGGCGVGDSEIQTNQFLSSTDGGQTWQAVQVEQGQTVSMRSHLSKPDEEDPEIFVKGKPFPPANMCGASLIVVDGSRFMLLGGQLEYIYVSLDSSAKQWAWIEPRDRRGNNPLLNRMHLSAWQDSSRAISVIGGYKKGDDKGSFSDVVVSRDNGRHWSVATANLDKDLSILDGVEYSGPGRHATFAVTGDDTVTVMGGQQNATVGLVSVWSSYEGAPDLKKPIVTKFSCPLGLYDSDRQFVISVSEPVHQMEPVSWKLREVVQVNGQDVASDVEVESSVWNSESTVLTIVPKLISYDKTYTISWGLGTFIDLDNNRIDSGEASCSFDAPASIALTPLASGTASYSVASNTSFEDVSPMTNLVIDFGFSDFEPVENATVTLKTTIGESVDMTTDHCKRIEQNWYCELPTGKRLTEAAEYQVAIGPNQFRNTKDRSLVNADTIFAQKFTVLSGSFSNSKYHQTQLPDETVEPVLNGSDAAPVVVLASPQNSAKDVGFEVDLFQMIKFDQSIQLSANSSNLSISLKFYNESSSAWVLASLTNTSDPTKVSLNNDTLQIRFAQLEKGKRYCIEIPAGVLDNGKTGYAGLACENHQLWTLKGQVDKVAPSVLAQMPEAGSTSAGTLNELRFYFSKPIAAGLGKVTVGPSGSALDLTAENSTFGSSSVVVHIADAALNPSANTLSRQVTISDGFVESTHGNTNMSEHVFSFTTSKVLKPVVQSISADACSSTTLSAGSTKYAGCPQEFTMKIELTNSVIMQADSEVVLMSTYSSPNIVFKVQDFSKSESGGKTVFSGLVVGQPGETYKMSISNTTFTDASGAFYSDGCATPATGSAPAVCGQTFEIEPQMKFRQLQQSSLPSPNFGAAALVTAQNQIVLVGGSNGTHAVSGVHKMATSLPTHCAASPDVWSVCDQNPCNGQADSLVEFDGKMVKAPFSSGKRSSQEKIVRQPSLGGRPCLSYSPVDASDSPNFACSGSHYDRDFQVFSRSFVSGTSTQESKCKVAWRDASNARGESLKSDCICPACFSSPTFDSQIEGFNVEQKTHQINHFDVNGSYVSGAGMPYADVDGAQTRYSHLVKQLQQHNGSDHYEVFQFGNASGGLFEFGEVMPMCGSFVSLQDGTPITSHWASNTFQCVAQQNDWYSNWNQTNDGDVHCDPMPCFEAPAIQNYYATSELSASNYDGNQCVSVTREDDQCANTKNPFHQDYSNSSYCMPGFSDDSHDNTCEVKCKAGYHRHADKVQTATCLLAEWQYPECHIYQCGDQWNSHPAVQNSNFQQVCTDAQVGHAKCEAPFDNAGACLEANPGVCDFKCNPGYEWQSSNESMAAQVVNMKVQCTPASTELESKVEWMTLSTNLGETIPTKTFQGNDFEGCVLRTCKRVEFANAKVNDVAPSDYAVNYPVAKFGESRKVVCDAGFGSFAGDSSAKGSIATDVKCDLASSDDETSDIFMTVTPREANPVEAPTSMCRKLTCPSISLANTVSADNDQAISSIDGQYGKSHSLKCAVGYESRNGATSVNGVFTSSCAHSDANNERTVAFTNVPNCVPKNCNLCSVKDRFSDDSQICPNGNSDILAHNAVRESDLLKCKNGNLVDNKISCEFGQTVFGCVPAGGSSSKSRAVVATVALGSVPKSLVEDAVLFASFVDESCDAAYKTMNPPGSPQSFPRSDFACEPFMARLLRSLRSLQDSVSVNLKIAIKAAADATSDVDVEALLEDPQFLQKFETAMKENIAANKDLSAVLPEGFEFDIQMSSAGVVDDFLFVDSSAAAWSLLTALVVVLLQ